jgi:pimeloyl-ACP methyl ester carboxylesterase
LSEIPGSRLVVYTGAGHGFHWEDPAQFTSDLVRFVTELQGNRQAAILDAR